MKSTSLLKIIITCLVLLPVKNINAQTPDSLNPVKTKNVYGYIGVDAFSALNAVSLIGGVEVNHSRYSLSLSHYWNSSRIGVYYDYCIWKKARLWTGLGFHNSFLLKEFKKSKADYIDSLRINRTETTLGNGAYLPSAAEVRHQYFFSLSLGKEFRIFKGLFFNIKVAGLLLINPYYSKTGISGIYGAQLYYKW